MAKKRRAHMAASSVNFNGYCKGLVQEGRCHPNRVVLASSASG